MNIDKEKLKSIAVFLISPVMRCVFLIAVLGIVTVTEFSILNLARRTFVFYTVKDGTVIVESRMLKHADTREGDIIRYTEETLLGPVSPGLLPLFPKETKLLSLLLREGVIYANLSLAAEMAPLEGGAAYDNFRTFCESLLRNFAYIDEVRFFIEGNAVYKDGFM